MTDENMSLRRAHLSEYEEIKKMLKKDFPTGRLMHQILEIHLSFDLSQANKPPNVYISDGTENVEFVFADCISSTSEGQQCSQAYWNVDSLQKNKIIQYMKLIPGYQFNQTFHLLAQNTEIFKIICDLISSNALGETSHLRITKNIPCYFFTLSPEDIPDEKRLPDGYRYGRLLPHHVPFVFSNWEYSPRESIRDFQKFFTILPSCAVFENEQNDSSNPVCYIYLNCFGMMGLTHTMPEHRRKGLGTAVTIKLANEIYNKYKITPMVTIQTFNKQSQLMHEKIGFKRELVNLSYTKHEK